MRKNRLNPWIENTNYIWLPNAQDKGKTEPVVALFRRELELPEVPEHVAVQITADTRYRFQVNGKDVCCGPCKGDLHVWHYETVDLAPYLTEGKNVLAAKVLRYPMEEKLGNLSMIRTEVPHFYLKEENEALGISTDENWMTKVCEGQQIQVESPYSKYLWDREIVDAKRIEIGWEKPDFEPDGWEAARVYTSGEVPRGRSPRNRMPRPIPLLPETERRWNGISCIRQSEAPEAAWKALLEQDEPLWLQADSEYVIELDAGQETTAYPFFILEGGEDSTWKMIWAEAYFVTDEEGNRIKRDRTDWQNGCILGYEDRYTAAGTGTAQDPEVYSTFWFRTFRFLKLEIRTGDKPLRLQKLGYRETGYPLEVLTDVQVSDPELEKISKLSLRTLQCCMHETYEDCPYYEQLQYAMDTRAQILFTYYTGADDRLARRCMDDFYRSLRPDGLTNCCYPSSGVNLIPGFSLYYIFMIHDHMMFFGDRDLVARYFLAVERILQFFETNLGEDGLVKQVGGYNGAHAYWSFIDWTDQWMWGVPNAVTQGALTMESMLYLMALQKTAELAAYLGKEEKAAEYIRKAEQLGRAIRENCYDEANGLFQDGPGYAADFSQHSQIFAILTGLVQGKEAEELARRMLARKDLAVCSVAMSFYYFRGLEAAGLYEEESRNLWEPWREMLRAHMTTSMENRLGTGRSDCHAWGATALYELPAVLLGVRPAKPGFAEALIRPCPGHLDWAKGSVTTPLGEICVKWERRPDGEITVSCDDSAYRGTVRF